MTHLSCLRHWGHSLRRPGALGHPHVFRGRHRVSPGRPWHHDHGLRGCGSGHGSVRDHGPCGHGPGPEYDHDHDPGDRSLGLRGVRSPVRIDPHVGESSHAGDAARRSDRGEVSDGVHGQIPYRSHGQIHDRIQISMMQKVEYEPTRNQNEINPYESGFQELTSIFRRSSRPMRLLCIS